MKISTVLRKKEKKSAGEANTSLRGNMSKASGEKAHKTSDKKPGGARGGRLRGKLRRNRMIITAFAIMIAVAGYLNYADRIESTQGAQDAELEAANAAADAAYEGDTLLDSDGDIESLDVDYDLVLSEDDLLEEVTETETAGDKDGGTGLEGTSEEGSGSSSEDASGEESGSSSEGTSDGETGSSSENVTGVETGSASGAAADGENVADASESADGTDTADATSSNIGESLFVSSTGVLTFVAEAKLSREQARAKSKETLLEIVDNDALSESAKQSAIDAMVELSNIAAMEAATETLLAAKGFTNSVVTIQEDSVDVIVNAEQLSDSERAQIEDIITQKTGISVANITIVPLRESEE